MLHPLIRHAGLVAANVGLFTSVLAAQRGALPPTDVTVVGAATSATVSWTPVASRGVTYRVLRGVDARSRGVDLTEPIAVATFEDLKVVAGASYFYQVVAVYADGSIGAATPAAFTFQPSGRGTAPPIGAAPIAIGNASSFAGKSIPLSPPNVSAFSTPLTVTVAWSPVTGAASYTVEQASSAGGPWMSIPVNPKAGTQVTAPTTAGTGGYSRLYFYRVTALPSVGAPGVTVVPRVTPDLISPLGVDARPDGADVRVSWAPVPHADGYVVTAALGAQLPPTHTVTVGAQSTEARLVNVAGPVNPRTVWIAVAARYGKGAALSNAIPRSVVLPGVQYCWPPSSVPGPAPTVSITAAGPTAFKVTTAKVLVGVGAQRVERAPMGSQTWENVGCGNGAVYDQSLTPGTQYQYRVSEIAPSGAVGQAIVVAATPPAPDSPTPTAILANCSAATGCQVTLNWNHVAAAQDYRIESSYGLYMPFTQTVGNSTQGGQPVSQPIGNVPKGVHSFSLTPLFPSMRPSPKPPGQVTVVVP